MPNGGKISFKLEKTNQNEVLICVTDDGCGIPKEHLNKIGEPFHSTKEKGTGLGLTVCYKIIQEHQGSIHFDGEVDVGSVVKVTLPRFYQTENTTKVKISAL